VLGLASCHSSALNDSSHASVDACATCAVDSGAPSPDATVVPGAPDVRAAEDTASELDSEPIVPPGPDRDASSETAVDALGPPLLVDAAATDWSPVDSAPATASGHIALTQDALNKLGFGNRAIDPQTLNVLLATKAISCNNPFGSVGGCSSWQPMFRLPPAMQ
jgi:hypothetical protein